MGLIDLRENRVAQVLVGVEFAQLTSFDNVTMLLNNNSEVDNLDQVGR